jgi:hypothetical protein
MLSMYSSCASLSLLRDLDLSKEPVFDELGLGAGAWLTSVEDALVVLPAASDDGRTIIWKPLILRH